MTEYRRVGGAVVEAFEFTPSNGVAMADWCRGRCFDDVLVVPSADVNVYRNSSPIAYPGMWVVKTGRGFRVYSREQFHDRYEVV